jgi:hypothetical protein
VPHVEQELLILLERMAESPVSSGVRVVRSLVVCVAFYRSLVCPFFFLAIVLSVFLRFTVSA